MEPEIISIALRITGETLRPSEVSSVLNLAPCRAHSKGDANIGKNGRHYGFFQNGVWLLNMPIQQGSNFGGQLMSFLTKLADKQGAIGRLRSAGLNCEIFVGLSSDEGNFGFSLPSTVLALLADLKLSIDFDLYCLPCKQNESSEENAQEAV